MRHWLITLACVLLILMTVWHEDVEREKRRDLEQRVTEIEKLIEENW